MVQKLAVVAAVSVLFAAVTMGAAAALDINDSTVQAGTDTDLVCDEDGVDTLLFDFTASGGVVTVERLLVSDVDTACFGKVLGYELKDGDDHRLAVGHKTITGHDVNLALPGPVDLAQVESIYLLIVG